MKDIAKTHMADIELNHHIQRQILNRFLHSDSQSYTELLIDGMSGNSFIYHLKALLRQKLIAKTSLHTYEITPFGKLVLDNLAFDTSRFLLRPAIGVFLIARTHNKEYMLYESARQPFIGISGFVFGKMLIGQSYTSTLEYMTTRRSIDDYTITATSPASIIYRLQGEIVSHRVGLMVLIDTPNATPERVTDAGKTYWVPEGEITLGIQNEVSLSLPEIGTSFIELDFEIPSKN
jgi:hypothetical protein